MVPEAGWPWIRVEATEQSPYRLDHCRGIGGTGPPMLGRFGKYHTALQLKPFLSEQWVQGKFGPYLSLLRENQALVRSCWLVLSTERAGERTTYSLP